MADLSTDYSLPPKEEIKTSRYCAGMCPLWSSKTFGLLMCLISGLCFMYICNIVILSESKYIYCAPNMPSSKPLERTRRLDVLARYRLRNLTYFKDGLNQDLSNFLQIASQVEELLLTYPDSEVKMFHLELMLILHDCEKSIQTGIENLRKIKQSLVPKQRRRPPVEK